MPNAWSPIVRWLVSMSEPLVPTPAKLAIEQEASREFSRNTTRAAIFVSGLVSDTLASLPDTDPWGRGKIGDGTDLVPRITESQDEDLFLAALSYGLGENSLRFLQACATSRESGQAQALHIKPDDMFATFAPAIRWATWRRRVYLGGSDDYLYTSGLLWVGISELMARGDTVDWSVWETHRESAKIPDSEYQPLPKL